MNTVIPLRRKKRFPVPVPPLKRKNEQPEMLALSDRTKSALVAVAILNTKQWSR